MIITTTYEILTISKPVSQLKMRTPFHYFSLFLSTLCFSIIIPAAHSKCLVDQQQSLLHFKKSLVYDASGSSKLSTWNSSVDCCSWIGVDCSADGRVLGLDISSEQVSGGIGNSSSLFQLQHLQSLNLAHNQLGKEVIPSAIGKLVNLRYLNLSHDLYSGEIPIEISRLTRLVILDVSDNEFYNPLSKLKKPKFDLHMLVENLRELTELYLDNVPISADGSEWCQAISSSLPHLRVLSLSYCNLTGPFHESLAKLRSLSVIQLESNNISAPVPSFFANFSNLTSLNLKYCNLQGTFPKEVFQLPSLQKISLSENEQLDGSLPDFPKNGSLQYLDLSGANFSGVLPNSIGNLKMLSTVDIGYCNFTGPIPKSMANLTQLVLLRMYRNHFVGSVPSFSRAKNLEEIDLSSNGLTGSINSTQWGNLTNLLHLNLEANMLDGNIPSSLFSLPLLELFLSANQFSGQFPENFNFSACSIQNLYLQGNNLEGPIPWSIFNMRYLTTLSLGFNNFSGSFPLDRIQPLKNLKELDLSYNSLSVTYDPTNISNSFFPILDTLMLASSNLKTIPNFLRDQAILTVLDLSDNQIHGEIPNWIWKLSSLSLLNLSCNSLETLEGPLGDLTSPYVVDLHSNQLHGQIPNFSSPYNSYLDYSKNYFSSSIPTEIGALLYKTKFFSASSNNLSGIIPASLCNSKSLEVIDLSDNFLSGTVPECLTTMSTFGVLNLRRNNLTSAHMVSTNCSLQTLDISGNHIEGHQFLKSLVNCTKLEVLNLGNNQIADPFPCFLKNMSTLRVLILRTNKFYGDIGCLQTNGTWPVLQILDLANNNFSGEVPGRAVTTWQAMMANRDDSTTKLNHLQFRDGDGTVYYQDSITVISKGLQMELVKILTIFTSIDFSCNKFTGSIPEEIGELKSLLVLNLSSNAFTSAIPSSLSNLSQLESLDLSKNNLIGQIPQQLTKLTFLSFLNLSNNLLVGRIPSGNQFSTFPKASFEGNKDLTGPPLTEDNTTVLSAPASRRSQPNSGDEIDWNIISIEIGFTCGFGIAIGSLLSCKRWRKWYYRAMYSLLVKIFPQLEQRFGHHRRHVYINQRYGRR